MLRFLNTNKEVLILKGKGLIHSLLSYTDLFFKVITNIPGNIHTWPNYGSRIQAKRPASK